jgi:hypothetical protein
MSLVKPILFQFPPTEWKSKLRNLAMDQLFEALCLQYAETGFRNVPSSVRDELRLFFSSFTKDDEGFENVLRTVESLPENNSLTSHKEALKQVQKLKYFFGRSHFFFEEEEEDWFNLISQISINQSGISCEDLNSFLNLSANLKLSQIQDIVCYRLSENWLHALYSSLLKHNFNQLLLKKGLNPDSTATTDFNKCIEKLEMSRNQELMYIICQKLSMEVQQTDLATMVEPSLLLQLIRKLFDSDSLEFPHSEILSKYQTLPFFQWDSIILEQELLKIWPKDIVNSALKAKYVANIETIKTFVEEYFKVFGNTDESRICDWLNAISNEMVILDEEVVAQLQKNKTISNPDSWNEALLKHSAKVKKSFRPLSELLSLLREDAKNKAILPLVDNGLKGMVTSLGGLLEKTSSMTDVCGNVKVGEWSSENIRAWAENFRSKSVARKARLLETKLPEILAVIGQGLFIFSRGKVRPRNVQFIALLLLLQLPTERKGRLAEIATGEGKTYICAMLGVLRALSGASVDIVTSSTVLAAANAKEMAGFYSLFGISVGNNCDEEAEKSEEIRARRYQNIVIYGDVSSFQRDLLLSRFFNRDILQNRVPGVVIIDEV